MAGHNSTDVNNWAFTFLEQHLLGSKSKFCRYKEGCDQMPQKCSCYSLQRFATLKVSKAKVPLSFLPRLHVHDAYICAIKVWWLQCTVLTATVLEGLKHFGTSASVSCWFQEENGRRGSQVPENNKQPGKNSPFVYAGVSLTSLYPAER